jgi:hypothetical protein
MKSLAQIRVQLARGDYVLSRHALRRVVERNIRETEVREAGTNVVIIEDYPTDKYSPSCLLLGFTAESRPLHIQVSREDSETTRIITIYEPNLDEWQAGYTVRR